MNNALICHVMRGDRYGHSWTCRLCGDHGGVYDDYEMARATAGKHLAMKHGEPS